VDAEELNNGTVIAKYGRIFIRGNNILYVKIDSTQVVWV
jgi:small nuclear ribonucleoprotein (snRNP)-like protein